MPPEVAPWAQLAQTIGIGAVLWFVLLRLETAMQAMTAALNRLTMQIALLLDRSARPAEALQQLLGDVDKHP